MKKLFLSAIAMYALMLQAFSQSPADSTGYKQKRLSFEEANLVSSYYSQNGNHSAVTGGIGTEKVTDLSNGLEVKFSGVTYGGNKHTFTAGLGIDHHTSASSAYVSKTGASQTGGSRIYPSLNWQVENPRKKTTFGAGAYLSSEYNYQSIGLDASFSKETHKNGQFSAKVNAYFDQVKLIYPSELVPGTTSSTDNGTTTYTTASRRTVTLGPGEHEGVYIPSSPRTTVSGSLSFSQVINKRLQGSLSFDVVGQTGYLGLPFHRVYFSDGTEAVEKLPSNRFKLPVGIRLNYFLGDKIILRSYYRYYTDDWGIQSHTASLEVPYKITPFLSVAPFYRYYVQTAAKYFAEYATHKATDEYYTSNYAYSAFNSGYAGVNVRIAPPKGVFNSSLSTLELRYGHYTQTTQLSANVITLAFTFK